VLAFLLTLRDIDVNAAEESDRYTPLHSANVRGNVNAVKHLLKREDLDVTATDIQWKTPLHLATSRDVATLLVYRLDVNAQDKLRNTPLFLACEHGNENMVEFLLSLSRTAVNAANEVGWTPLHIAAMKNRERIVAMLIRSPNVRVNVGESYETELTLELAKVPFENIPEFGCRTPLYFACQEGHRNVVRLLTTHSNVDVNAVGGSCSFTPLHVACSHNRLAVVRVLVDTFGVDVHAANKRGRTPLHIACETGGSALLIALSKSKVGIDASVRNPVDGKTSLHVAVKRGDLKVVRELLERFENELNARSATLTTALQYAVYNDQTSVAQLLIEVGANVNVVTQNKLTPLDLATSKRMKELIISYGEKAFR